MSSTIDNNAGIRILCFDAGGPGTYSYDIFLREIMGQLASELGGDEDDILPRDYFELMAGTGFGGLFALFLGHLGMTVNQATEKLLDIVTAIFPDTTEEKITPESRTQRLRNAIEEVLESAGFSITARMYEKEQPSPRCKVVLYSATSALVNHPHAMRTYGSRGATLNPTIVEAACATVCSPGLFSPIKIGPKLRQQSFVGPPQGVHNPTREAFKEAKAIYGPDRRVAQVLSFGCGQQRAASLDKDHPEQTMARLVSNMAIDCDRVAEELSQRLMNADAYLRLSVTSGIEDLSFEDWTTLGDIGTHAKAYVGTAAVQRAIKLSARHLKERIGSVTLLQLNEIQSIKVMAKCAPAVTPHFVERAEVSDAIIRHITETPGDKQKILPITGMGGCGKTQMVSHILQKHRTRFEHQVYTDASSLSSLRADLQNWMRAKGTGYEQATWEDAVAHLSRIEGWVLVFDNADDRILDLVPYFPKCHHGFIFITSRNRLVGNLSTTMHVELGRMSPGEAMSALLGASRRSEALPISEQRDAEALLVQLGHLPLAIVQAGSYCHQLSSSTNGIAQPFTFTQYAKLLKSHRPRLLREAQMASLDQYERSVYSTLELSCLQLAAKDLEFLQVVCNFDCSDLSLQVLEMAAEEGFKDPHEYLQRPEEHWVVIRKLKELLTYDGKWDEMGVQKTVASLSSFSILSSISIDGVIHVNIHPLVQAFVCDSTDAASSGIVYQMSAQIITACNVEKAVVIMQLVPSHIQHIIETDGGKKLHLNTRMAFVSTMRRRGYWDVAARLGEAAHQELVTAKGEDDFETIRAGADLATTYYAQGKWDRMESLCLAVLEKRERLLPEDHPDTVTAMARVAEVYYERGRWDIAEDLELKVLEKRQRLLPEDHPDAIQATANLATTYYAQGKWGKAERLYLEVLEKRQRLLPEDHPDTVQATASLAATYHEQGKWDKAERLKLEVLEKRQRLLPEDHPDTIRATADLATTYYTQGKWSKAERLYLEVLEKWQRLLPEDHPDTIQATASLATTYYAQGKWDKAERLELEVLEKRQRLLPEDHPDTIQATANLAATYHKQGKWDKAERLELEVLEKRQRLLPEDHPDTIQATANLAGTYGAQGKWDKAERLYLEVLEKRQRLLPEDHPDTIHATASLATTYYAQGKWDKAERLKLEVLEKRQRLLPEDHPDTIRATANLAATYHKQGKWDKAERLELEVLEKRQRLLPEDHPDTIQATANLAGTYGAQGKWDKAERLYLEVLEKRQRLLPEDHPDTIHATASLATTYYAQGKWDDAERLYLEVLEKRQRLLPEDHPDTIEATASLAATYHEQGKWDKAERLKLEVLEKRQRLLPEDHPDTILATANLAATYHKQGKWDKAERLDLEVLEKRQRLLPEDHPDTIRATANLAGTYYAQGKWDDAERLYLEVLEKRQRLLPEDHPDTIEATASLATTYSAQGKWDKAERLELEVLEKQQRLLPVDHPSTLHAACNLAVTYNCQRKWLSASQVHGDVVPTAIHSFGQNHPHVRWHITTARDYLEGLGEAAKVQEMDDLLDSLP